MAFGDVVGHGVVDPHVEFPGRTGARRLVFTGSGGHQHPRAVGGACGTPFTLIGPPAVECNRRHGSGFNVVVVGGAAFVGELFFIFAVPLGDRAAGYEVVVAEVRRLVEDGSWRMAGGGRPFSEGSAVGRPDVWGEIRRGFGPAKPKFVSVPVQERAHAEICPDPRGRGKKATVDFGSRRAVGVIGFGARNADIFGHPALSVRVET